MTDSNSRKILSHIADDEFVEREVELARICSLARGSVSIALLLGRPRAGKTELLRQSFDRLFSEGGETMPFFYILRRYCLNTEKFAGDYFSQFLAQFIAFRRNDPRLIQVADEPLAVISRAAAPEDYLWVRSMVDSFLRASQSGDAPSLVRFALSVPAVVAARSGLKPLVMIDNWHLIAQSELQAEFTRAMESIGTREQHDAKYLVTGLRRLVTELMPPNQEIFGRTELVNLKPISNESVGTLTRRRAELLGVETSDSTIELMAQQLNCDVFYTDAILNAASSRGLPLKTFIEFERIYSGEVLSGRIGHYIDSLLRDVAPERRDARAVLEALALISEAGSPVPFGAVTERMGEHSSDCEGLLSRLHAREMLEISYGFVNESGDPVLRDYVRAKYRNEIAGAAGPVAGTELLSEKLKDSYRLMMSRFSRGIESQLIDLLSRFDSQNVPASLFDEATHDTAYRGMSRVQVRRALGDEQERIRLPQIVLVHNIGSGEQAGVNWQIFAATGFEGAIYTDANEVLWLVALINSKEPLDVETLGRIDQRLEPASRGPGAKAKAHAVRWYISKEGFSAVASERLLSLRAYRSTYSHLDLLQDSLTSLSLGSGPRPTSEFELVIPVEEEAELIAARTAEQIARAADFDQEAINQIKTALIEACINAAEHGESPDKKIHQHFAIDEDKLIITVSNKGKKFGGANGQSAPSVRNRPAKGTRGRGLQIIRALMDEVKFERADDGSRLVMIKYLNRPRNQ